MIFKILDAGNEYIERHPQKYALRQKFLFIVYQFFNLSFFMNHRTCFQFYHQFRHLFSLKMFRIVNIAEKQLNIFYYFFCCIKVIVNFSDTDNLTSINFWYKLIHLNLLVLFIRKKRAISVFY